MNSFFSWRNLFGTITIFVILMLLRTVALNLDFLNVFNEIQSSYNVTDVIFSESSQLREEIEADTNIVLVNIGTLDRSGIAAQLEIINKYQPKVVGIDAFFYTLRDPVSDSLLTDAMSKTKHLIQGTKLIGGRETAEGEVVWDSLETSHPRFMRYGETGFVNALTKDNTSFETWREVVISEKLRSGDIEKTFALKIVEKFDSLKAKKCLERKRITEIINFRGNLDKFTKLDVEDIFDENFTPETIRGKIVLLGYLGGSYTNTFWDDDKYYTPLNAKPIGRTAPDMYGVVVHANIISMILSEDYIDEIPEYWSWIMAIVMCYLNVALFSRINYSEYLDIWYGVLTKLVQVAEVIILIYILLITFSKYNLKLEMTLTIAVVLLSGDILEFYFVLILNLYKKARDYFLKLLGKKI